MRRKNDPYQRMQDEAHMLLLEWGSGPGEAAPEDGNVQERVQGGDRPLSTPERYALRQGRWHSLDKAVQRTHEQNPDLGRVIWWLYGEGLELRYCVGLMTGKDPQSEGDDRLTTEDWKAWRDRRRSAAALFMSHYRMLCAGDRGSQHVAQNA